MNTCLWCGVEEMPVIRLADLIGLSKISSKPLCRKCSFLVSLLDDQSTCNGCGRVWEGSELCPDCIRWKEQYPQYDFQNEALYEYNSFMKDWIEAYKFKGDYRLGKVVAEPLKKKITQKIDHSWLTVPIPVSKKSMENRGFNQVAGLLSFAEVNYLEVLKHIGTGEKQSSKNRKERMITPQPFEVRKEMLDIVVDKKILLIDDVYTTGRTLFHAAECLLSKGAVSVRTLTIAR
ncbi:ComF family protein [Desemzia sp. C1]|uniref:ComF family protein n=1 Tax=Desemzia TaxID=82800 RepID=UPI0016613469|nr:MULTISPECIES: ComF family protein [Desemzia]MCI3029041.1 ComF family protein [Desemzia sp. C1]